MTLSQIHFEMHFIKEKTLTFVPQVTIMNQNSFCKQHLHIKNYKLKEFAGIQNMYKRSTEKHLILTPKICTLSQSSATKLKSIAIHG